MGVTHHRVVPAPPQRALPLLPRSYGLMRPTILLALFSASLIQRVFAGCGEPLLEDGGSRRYLCVSVPRCLDLYPGGVVGACTHYFPTTVGLPPVPMRSAPRNNPLSDFRAGVISGLQSFAHVQAPPLARPPDRSHRSPQTGRPGRLHHASPKGLPTLGCGIATCLIWAIDMAGLAPASLKIS
jgi:hypothetical protein